MQAMRGLRAAAVARQGQRAGDASDQATKPKKKLGRKPASEDAKQKDQKIYEAWQSGRYKDYSDLAMQFDLKRKDVERAIDRHEKRIKPKE